MPLNDIIKEVSRKNDSPTAPEGQAPSAEAAGMPSGEPSPTTMDTPDMLPPWLHNQLTSDQSLLALSGAVLTIISLIKLVEEHVL